MELSDYVRKLTEEIKKIHEEGEVTVRSLEITVDAEGKPLSAKMDVG